MEYKQQVARSIDGEDFVVALLPENEVVFRTKDARARRNHCRRLRWKIAVNATLSTDNWTWRPDMTPTRAKSADAPQPSEARDAPDHKEKSTGYKQRFGPGSEQKRPKSAPKYPTETRAPAGVLLGSLPAVHRPSHSRAKHLSIDHAIRSPWRRRKSLASAAMPRFPCSW
jgi:hypothetical protein